jgi:uncharacterized cupin superfamily protein
MENAVTKSIVMATTTCAELAPSPIPAEWILGGTPEAWEKQITATHDRISQIFVWECTAGHFQWHYKKDESVVVISGEAFLVKPDGQEVRFGAGDVGYFPASTICTWRVPGRFRKVAILREPMWRPLGYAAKAWNRLVRRVGFAGRPSITGLDHVGLSSNPHQAG